MVALNSVVLAVLLSTCLAQVARKNIRMRCDPTEDKTYTKTITVRMPNGRCPAVRAGNRRPLILSAKRNSYAKKRAKEMMTAFPGLFIHENEAAKVNTKYKTEKGRGLQIGRGLYRRINHDGDLHCPTHRTLKRAPDVLTNVYKRQKDIVHFASEGVYQYIHTGSCGSKKKRCSGGGGCIQETSIVYMMVWADNPDWPISFEPFEVDTYCSCRGVTLK